MYSDNIDISQLVGKTLKSVENKDNEAKEGLEISMKYAPKTNLMNCNDR